jgi:two-component system cell cycle response regulator
VAVAAGLLVHLLNAVLAADAGLEPAIVDRLYLGLFGATSASCALRALREWRGGGKPLPWILAAAGVAVWGSAEAAFRIIEPDPAGSYPRLTQTLLVISFGLGAATLVLLSRQRIAGFSKGLALDGLIGGLAVAAIAAAFLFPAGSAHAGISQSGPPVLFLLGDLAILTFVVVALALTGWRPGWCWGLMGAGIVVNLIGNIALVEATATGSFHRGSPVDTLYAGSVLLLGLAAWYPIVPAVRRDSEDARRVAAPLLFAVVALGLLAYGSLEGIGPLAAVLAVATLVAVLVRTGLAFRDNHDLLLARSRDSLTDGLTSLGNRRMLMRELELALSEAEAGLPRTLLLFDLDGFKSYNDTFGHPAGDALLARLGSKLRDATAPYGPAFRMGGDEFCLLVRTTEVNLDAVIAKASEALSEVGGAFEVRTSFGRAVLGDEATSASAALQLADERMYGQKRTRNGSLAGETRALLLSILREREPGLDDHLHAVAGLARGVGAQFDLDNDQLDVLVRAAELHDIGKMAMPDAILLKPGPLTEQEWEIMRRHTVIGERILKTVPALAPVAAVVRATHERMDGTGYPDGLRGEQIPLAARIVAVCDAYNAMTSERAYDQARPREQAVEELRRLAGTQFDPVVVDAFCRSVGLAEDGSGPLAEPAEFDRRAWVTTGSR